MPVLVRDAVESDASKLCALWAGPLHRPEVDDGSAREAEAAEAVAQTARDPLARIVVAEVDGALLGCAYLRIGHLSPIRAERVILVNHLQVAKHAERLGVGRALLEAAVSWAEHEGIVSLVAPAAANDREANRFLARLGMAQLAVLRGAKVAALRARLPGDPSAAVRAGRTSRNVGHVVALRRSQRRSRGPDLVV
ncbi:MAG TPA: GNAT family N-acetyltransferase [Marmoricola sp.]|nr:GNAT family N-acetyltransferase [Marmoricola sp.]